MTVRSAWLLPGPGGQTREDTRLVPLGTMTPTSELGTRAGILAGGNPFAAGGVSAMQVQVGIGRALVQGTIAQGAYPVAVTTPETLTIGDGNAQFARTDSVILRVYDGLYDTSGQTLATVEILAGDPLATPVEKTLPAGSLRLWNITVPAGTSVGTGGLNWSTALADRRRYTTAHGGILPKGYAPPSTGAYDGQYRDTGSTLERWSAVRGAWETYRPPLLVETVTTGFDADLPYATNSFTARRGNGMATMVLEVNRLGVSYDVPAHGNITPDQKVGQIPAGWFPFADVDMPVSDGVGHGTARLTTGGVITLRTWSGTGSLEAGNNIRMAATYFLKTG
ncbi:hypothetical protein [Streptomyces chryseus]